jgi:hypothetical protein
LIMRALPLVAGRAQGLTVGDIRSSSTDERDFVVGVPACRQISAATLATSLRY